MALLSLAVRLYRQAVGGNTAGYWNGTGFDATYNLTTHELAATVTGTTTTTWSLNLPALAVGSYTLVATAKDTLGNYSVAGVGATARSGAPSGANTAKATNNSFVSFSVVASAPVLENISSFASASSVSLDFSSGVPSGFAVKVNSKSVACQVVKEGLSVTLLLPDKSLQVGDAVVVAWNGGTAQITAE